MALDLKDFNCGEPYSPEISTVWDDALTDSVPSTTSPEVPLQPLSSREEIFSTFGEKDCGEPAKPQRLSIDFTPDPLLDNLESQKKCCSFWDFIKAQPSLKMMCVKPDPTLERNYVKPKVSPPPSAQGFEIKGTAMSLLGKNYVEFAFRGKTPKSRCSLGSEEYHDSRNDYPRTKSMESPMKLETCTCSGVCTKCKKSKHTSKPKRSAVQEQVKDLCKVLDEWDQKHPKSMDPPAHVVEYRPKLQRKLPPRQDPKTCLD